MAFRPARRPVRKCRPRESTSSYHWWEWFFQKEAAPSFPKWLRIELAEDIHYVIGEDRATLLFLANLGCIDHNPWMSRIGSLEHPDFLLIDLDPQASMPPRPRLR